jgi:hypothetical protein
MEVTQSEDRGSLFVDLTFRKGRKEAAVTDLFAIFL